MKQKRDNSPAVTVQVKYKIKAIPPETKSEHAILLENERKFRRGKDKDLSNYIRSRTLSVTCKCKE